MNKQPPVVARRVVRGKNGRFTCAMPLRNPTGELILPREYWDRPFTDRPSARPSARQTARA